MGVQWGRENALKVLASQLESSITIFWQVNCSSFLQDEKAYYDGNNLYHLHSEPSSSSFRERERSCSDCSRLFHLGGFNCN